MSEFYMVVNKADKSETNHSSLKAAVRSYKLVAFSMEHMLRHMFAGKLSEKEIVKAAQDVFCVKVVHYVREERVLEYDDIIEMEMDLCDE